MITRKHPCREPLADLTSSNSFYEHKSDFVPLADRILDQYGWTLGSFDMPGDTGRTRAPIEDANGQEMGEFFVSWYRMPSGRYEITCYVI